MWHSKFLSDLWLKNALNMLMPFFHTCLLALKCFW
jgi:hypothetical protein